MTNRLWSPMQPVRPPSRQRAAAKARSAAKSSVKTLDMWTYTPGDLLPELTDHVGSKLKVYIPSRFLTTLNDRVFQDRQVMAMRRVGEDLRMHQRKGVAACDSSWPTLH